MQNSRKYLVTLGVLVLDMLLISGWLFWGDLNDSFESVGGLALPVYWVILSVVNVFVALWLVRLWAPSTKIRQAISLFLATLLALPWTWGLIFVVPFYFSDQWKPLYEEHVRKQNLESLEFLKQVYQEPSYLSPAFSFGKEQTAESWKSGSYFRLRTIYRCTPPNVPAKWLSIIFSSASYRPNLSVYPDRQELQISGKQAVFYTAVFGTTYSFLVIYDDNATIELSDECGISREELIKIASSLQQAEFKGTYVDYGF